MRSAEEEFWEFVYPRTVDAVLDSLERREPERDGRS